MLCKWKGARDIWFEMKGRGFYGKSNFAGSPQKESPISRALRGLGVQSRSPVGF